MSSHTKQLSKWLSSLLIAACSIPLMLLACADSTAPKKKATTVGVDARPVTRERLKRPEHPRPAAPCMPDRLQFTIELTQFSRAYCPSRGDGEYPMVFDLVDVDPCLENDLLFWKDELNLEEQQALMLVFMKLHHYQLRTFRYGQLLENQFGMIELWPPFVAAMVNCYPKGHELHHPLIWLENHPELATPEVLTEAEGVLMLEEWLTSCKSMWDDPWEAESDDECAGLRRLTQWEALPDCSCPTAI